MGKNDRIRRVPSSAGITCFLFLMLIPFSYAVEVSNYSGKSLAEVIEDVRAKTGAEFVYSTRLVKATDYVRIQPQGNDPIELLRQILLDHGLALNQDDDTYYVVRASAERQRNAEQSTVVIVVLDEFSQTRLPDAEVRISADNVKVERLADGTFQVSELYPGRYLVSATAPEYQQQHQSVRLSQGANGTFKLGIVPLNQTKLEDIVVTTSRYDLVRESGASISSFDIETLQSLPNLGGDPLRVTQRLPGAASGGLSAKVHIRGGEENETLLVLDGLELTDPFHLRDYQSVFSAINQRILSGVDVYTGGFPATFGDKLSSVINMRSFEPLELQHEVSLSFLNTSVLSSGLFADGDGEWIFSARRGNLDLFIDAIDDSLGEPDYADAFAHLGYRVGDRTTLSVNGFVADDKVLVVPESDAAEREQAQSDTRNVHTWVTLDNQWTDDLFTRTLFANTHIDNFRRGFLNDQEGVIGSVSDRRSLDEFAVKQDWSWRATSKHQTQWGFQYKRATADYDYASNALAFDILADLDSVSESIDRSSRLRLDGTDYSLYVSNRWRPSDKLTTELGVRWDNQTYTPGHSQWSPRINVLYRLSQKSDLRLSIGRFHQSQRLHNLQIEDGVEEFFPAQRADHFIVGFEHRFPENINVRIEAYKKRFDKLRSRFENLFDPLVILPELSTDRIRIDPDISMAEGIEVYVSREADQGVNWWTGYTYSKIEDEFGNSTIARSWDQRHAVTSGISYSNDRWDLSLAAIFRSGWPTTSLSITTEIDDQGELEAIPELGPRNAARLGSFTSIDIHVARNFQLAGGSRLSLFLDVINAFSSENPCCVEYDVEGEVSGELILTREIENWLPVIPSIGIRWEF